MSWHLLVLGLLLVWISGVGRGVVVPFDLESNGMVESGVGRLVETSETAINNKNEIRYLKLINKLC